MQSSVNMAAQGFQRMTDQFTQTLGFNGPQSEDLARRSSQNLQAVSQASTILLKGVQDISREWFGLAQKRLTKNMDGLCRLAGCRSVQDFVTVQSDLARDNLQQMIDTNKRVAELSVRVADEAGRSIQAQGGASVHRARGLNTLALRTTTMRPGLAPGPFARQQPPTLGASHALSAQRWGCPAPQSFHSIRRGLAARLHSVLGLRLFAAAGGAPALREASCPRRSRTLTVRW